MTRLVLIRHGETDWNLEGRWQGHADLPLNRTGLEQSDRLANELLATMTFHAIYSSDLLRARQTAAALSHATGLEVRLDRRLREIDQGEWQGSLLPEIEARYGQLLIQRSEDPWNVAPPGGETAGQVRRRMVAALDDIALEHPAGVVAVVTHGYVIAVIRAVIAGDAVKHIWKFVPPNCTPVMLDWPQRSGIRAD